VDDVVVCRAVEAGATATLPIDIIIGGAEGPTYPRGGFTLDDALASTYRSSSSLNNLVSREIYLLSLQEQIKGIIIISAFP
jgi:hypothetical protein